MVRGIPLRDSPTPPEPNIPSKDIPPYLTFPFRGRLLTVQTSCEVSPSAMMKMYWLRLGGADLLALYVFGWSENENEPITRDKLVAMNKLLREGSLSEIK